MRYLLDFGSANAGGAPTFSVFARLDTFGALTPPAIVESPDGQGQYYFDYDWTQAPVGVQSVAYKATLNGIELSDVISGVPGPGVVTTTAANSSLSGFSTAGTIVSRAGVQLGIGKVSDPYASTDPNFIQLCELLATVGDDIQSQHDWPQIRKEATFVTITNQNTYALPADFHEMVDQSGWNRSTRMPLAGPASSQEWQYLKSRAPSLLINVVFRLDSPGIIEVNPGASPPANQTIAFEYISENWAQSAASSTGPDLGAPTQSSDWVLFDPELMIAALKVAWLSEKGFDTQKAEERFSIKLAHCIEKSTGAVTISLDGALRGVDRLLDDRNLPITGFGQ